jgi:S-adenosylmethionine:tRNA ribosyltransferase-isomerase
MVFHKRTGASIEIFCLEPADPQDHMLAFASRRGCTWKCLVGNAKKWKSGPVILNTRVEGAALELRATLKNRESDGFLVSFQWDDDSISFGEIIEQAGQTPIPPYLNREAEDEDRLRYQTVYGRLPGSVAAPTAGLHFTPRILEELLKIGIPSEEITLHVGAGTFVPIKHQDAREHLMHAELVEVPAAFLNTWLTRKEELVAVGTTTARSLETLYWLGVRILSGHSPDPHRLVFRQWENESLPQDIPLQESLESLAGFCRTHQLDALRFTTGMMIIPGYTFRSVNGLITNFHMPGSTLLLLIAALIGDDWRKVYEEALARDYRFLSYGDSSLLLPRLQV